LRQHLTPRRQGTIWRQAGGLLTECWYKEGSPERREWEQGWKQANTEALACHAFFREFGRLPSKEELEKFNQATDNLIEGEEDN